MPLRPSTLRYVAAVPVLWAVWLTLRALQDNTKHAFLQMDDRVLVYRGADQPDMSVINPESDVWQHIKVRARVLLPNVFRSTDLGLGSRGRSPPRTSPCNTQYDTPSSLPTLD